MQLDIKGLHLEVTPALKELITKKLDKLEHKSHIIDAHVSLKIINDHEQQAMGTIHIKGHHIEADAKHKDMYAAIDEMVNKLERQLIKHKEKVQKH